MKERQRILLIDELKTSRDHFVAALRSAAFDVEEVESGRSGWSALQKSRFDLVFISLSLQDWDAITLVEQLRLREAGGSHAPVLAITTEEEPKAVYMKCLAVGVNGFVERTVERERLSAVAGVFLRLVEEPANVEAPRC